MLFLLLNGAQYARPKMAVRSTQGQNRAVSSTQGGECVTLIIPSRLLVVKVWLQTTASENLTYKYLHIIAHS